MNKIKDIIHDRSFPLVTAVIIILNILVFAIETIVGDSENIYTALKFGAYYHENITQGEWYRFFTCWFVHFGFEHIGSNMLALFAVGPYVERYFGKVKFIIIYLASGICGTIAVIIHEAAIHEYAVSAGASGCIFGLFGILLIFAISRDMRYEFPLPRVLVGMVLMFVPSFTETGIGVDAHIGGFVGGTIAGFIFYLLQCRKNYYRK